MICMSFLSFGSVLPGRVLLWVGVLEGIDGNVKGVVRIAHMDFVLTGYIYYRPRIGPG